VDRRWSDLEKNCKHDKGLEAAGQGWRGKATGDLGWRAGKELDATSTNLGRKLEISKNLTRLMSWWKIILSE
jgi:hypothetical protein